MLVIPAIDVLGGRCVRLLQGSYAHETVYANDPARMARRWQEHHARYVHVVDLDAARGGSPGHPDNRTEIARICEAVAIPVQVGGGVRSLKDIDAVLALGVARVILGTAAVQDPDLVSEAVERYSAARIVVGIDAMGGEVRVEGWTEGSGTDAVDLALDMEARGVRRIVYTDISRDGTMEGPNVAAYKDLGRHLNKMMITASGGVGCHADLEKIATLQPYRVDSVIVGRALYENRLPLQELWQMRDANADSGVNDSNNAISSCL